MAPHAGQVDRSVGDAGLIKKQPPPTFCYHRLSISYTGQQADHDPRGRRLVETLAT
jgi:hypothetical protein